MEGLVNHSGAVARECSVNGPRPCRPERYRFGAEYVHLLASGDCETGNHFTTYFGELLSDKLRLRLRSVHLIEDARQETFLRVLKTLRKTNGLAIPEALGAFVNSVCNNVLFEMYRSGSKTTEITADRVVERFEAEASLVRQEERAHVRQILEDLPEKESQLLRWLFLEERDKDDVCHQLKVSRQYLRVLLHRAKLHFRAAYLRRHKHPCRRPSRLGAVKHRA
jgi:RNA polymerase sigma-70 factor (ECF subfamily)